MSGHARDTLAYPRGRPEANLQILPITLADDARGTRSRVASRRRSCGRVLRARTDVCVRRDGTNVCSSCDEEPRNPFRVVIEERGRRTSVATAATSPLAHESDSSDANGKHMIAKWPPNRSVRPCAQCYHVARKKVCTARMYRVFDNVNSVDAAPSARPVTIR